MYSFAQQRRASLRGGRGVGVAPQGDGVAAEASPGAGREQRVVRVPGSLAQPGAQQPLDRAGEGNGALLAPLALAADVRAGAQGDVGAVQAGEFGDPQAGLDRRQEHEDAIASTFPAGLVRSGEQGVDLG
jgi:hypothetical protein